MSYKTDCIDQAILSQLPTVKSEAASIADLNRFGARVGTVRAALKRLVEAGEVERLWDGNERFGRFLYFAK